MYQPPKCNELEATKREVSSPKILKSAFMMQPFMSFINVMKRMGPNTEP